MDYSNFLVQAKHCDAADQC